MSAPHIPCLTAANRNPTLRHAVRRLSALGLNSDRVRLTMTPDSELAGQSANPTRCNTWQEIYDQHPPPGTRLTATTQIIVYVDPDCGSPGMVALKPANGQSTTAALNNTQAAPENRTENDVSPPLSPKELSRRLWELGELQNQQAHPPDLLAQLLLQIPEFLQTFCGLTPDILATFSPDQIATLVRLLPLKRNSHQLYILSRLFSQILGFNCTFQRTCTPSLPHILLATLEAPRDQITPAEQARIDLLEHLLVPATCQVVYLYRHPIAVLDHTSARLDATQAG